MKERPILFSAPMVRAILAGTKTQTRRSWRVQPLPGVRVGWVPGQTKQSYGWPGDRLWVRETWAGPLVSMEQWEETADPAAFDDVTYCQYAADIGPAPEYLNADECLVQRWIPSIHMPRWASRITLEIIEVRAERLHNISCDDALDEGIVKLPDGYGLPDGSHFHAADPRCSYLSLWEAINGRESVEANPWVWAISFKRVQP